MLPVSTLGEKGEEHTLVLLLCVENDNQILSSIKSIG